MTVTIEELNEIQREARYARFINTNLHLHTPATPNDWNSRPNQTYKAEDITPELYFELLNKTSLDLVAITDHNSILWCESLMRLARESRKKGISKLHILPGLEITTYEGPHLIAIFPENFEIIQDIHKFITKLGLSGSGKSDERVSKGEPDQITISKIIKMVNDLGGLIIGPHIQSKDGIYGSELRGKEDILNDDYLKILAAPSGSIKIVKESSKRRLLYKFMDSERIHNSFAFINISDCHRVEDFELDTTWIKVSEPTLEGIKQIIFEPELRICHKEVLTDKKVEYPLSFEFSTPTEVTHDHLIGLAITGGMFNNQKIAFSPHQNCIIGKNYAGKSSILDCIRFVTDDFKSKEEFARQKIADRLHGILTEGGEVRAYIIKNGKFFALSRKLITSKEKNHYIIEGKPEVYALIGIEFLRQSDSDVQDILNLETYAQGEVVNIKDNSLKQMTILDSLSNVNELLQNVNCDDDNGTTISSKLKINSQKLITLYDQAASQNEEIQTIENLKKEIDDLEKLAKSPILDEIKQCCEAESTIEKHLKILKDLEKNIDEILEELPPRDQCININLKIDVENASREELTNYAFYIFNRPIEELSEALSKIPIHSAIDNLESIRNKIQNIKDTVTERFKSENDCNSTDAGIAVLISSKKKTLLTLLEKKEELDEKELKIRKLENERINLLEKYNVVWDEIRIARKKVIEIINNNSVENVQAELLEGGDRTTYRTRLEDIASNLTSQSNKISSKASQLDLITENITPDQLIHIVKTSDVAQFVENARVSENTARILIGMGKADLHKLEMCKLHDKFIIKFRKEGDDVFTPIDSGLSGGEQALALLSIAMVPKEYPLIIDQPEDELGTALITEELVEQIRKVKHQRQLILVTHIANIPVLADSEYVIYIQQNINIDKKEIIASKTGSLENKEIITRLLELEGGKFAFAKRNKRYSVVINEINK